MFASQLQWEGPRLLWDGDLVAMGVRAGRWCVMSWRTGLETDDQSIILPDPTLTRECFCAL